MIKKEELFKIAAFIILFSFWSLGLYYLGKAEGYQKAKAEQQAKIKLDKKTLDKHEKELKTISTESSNDANSRLRKNLQSN